MKKINTFIDKLLQGAKVEWKTLGEVVATITAPSKVKREAYRLTGKIPIVDQGINFIAGYTNEDLPTVPSDEYIVFGDHSEHIKYVNFSFVQGADGLKILKTKGDNTKFLYYAFLNFYQKELNYKRHWATAKETLIPIPPLPIQNEIVRILDTFTELTTKLTTELTARKKQYDFYRDNLLTFKDGSVEWKTLGEVAEIKNGKDWKNLGEGDIPVYGSGGIMRYVDTSVYSKPSVLIPRKGSLGNLFYVDTPFWNVDTIFYTKIDNLQIVPKFFYYFLTTIGLAEMNQAGGVPSQTQAVLNTIKIPIPTLAEQERIVSILDKFDTLTTSISEGLPHEIELRQKQYEYYRDQLLTFPLSEL